MEILYSRPQLFFKLYSKLMVSIIAMIVICSSVAVLFGWNYQVTFLKSISPSWTSMKVNTAFCFVMSGVALLIVNLRSPNQIARSLILALSVIILLVGTLTLFEYISGVDIGIDNALFQDFATLYSGRMPVSTILNFLLTAVSLLLLNKKNTNPWIYQIFAWIIFSISLFSLCHYLYNDTHEHNLIAILTTMALNTTLLFLLISIGILLTRPDDGILQLLLGNTLGAHVLRVVIPFIVLTPIVIIYIENIGSESGLYSDRFGDSINALGSFTALSIIIALVAKLINREIEKRMQTVKQLEESELLFHEFAEKIDAVFFKTTIELDTILYVSPAFKKIWGLELEDLYKNPRSWFESIIPEDREKVADTFFKKIKTTSKVSIEYRIRRYPDGSIRTIYANGYQIKDKNNQFIAIIGIAVDMTEMITLKKFNSAELDIMKILSTRNTIDEVVPTILKITCEVFEWDIGELWLVDETKKVLRCVNVWYKNIEKVKKFQLESAKCTFALDEGLPGQVWKNKQPYWIADYAKYRKFSRSSNAAKASLNCAFGLPLLHQNKVIGVIDYFANKVQQPDNQAMQFLEKTSISLSEFIHQKYSEEQVKTLSHFDILTGLLNRSAVEEKLNNLITDKKYLNVAVVICDVSRFKLINESLGHNTGDSLIKLIGARIQAAVNKDNTLIARLGADKFIICYYSLKSIKILQKYSRTIQQAFTDPFLLSMQKIGLTVRLGIAIYPKDGTDAQTLIKNANIANSHAKFMEGKYIEYFSSHMSDIATDRIVLETELKQALISNELIFYFQPQVDLKTDEICGVEALVRWQHPVKGMILPGKFIPYAEEIGLIIPIQDYLLRLIFRIVNSNWSGPRVSVNISSQQFGDGSHLLDYIDQLTEEFNVAPQNIEFEITENLLVQNTEHNLAILWALKKRGFHFAIDDFGTGFSSFNYLSLIPATNIKIDRSFINGLPKNNDNVLIIKSIIHLSHNLNKKVVAEGAETEEEIQFLKQEHCDAVQGFYYYKPMPLDDFILLLKKKNK